MRQIPADGINLFQLIYVLIREYEEKMGVKVLNLSLGNPDAIPAPEVLERKARFAGKPDYDLHTYAEDKNLGQFAENMVEACSGVRLGDHPDWRATPIAGIKTATAILPLACGLHLKGRENFSVVTHLPAYDVMGTWAGNYLGANRIVWPLRSADGMKMRTELLLEALKKSPKKPDLVFVIRPGNPASAGATLEEWKPLMKVCAENGIRLVNDGAYATLTDGVSHISLAAAAAKVGADYPGLEWAEMYSVSKSFSDPGQRLGVLVGTKDFVEDFILIKGNTDSGPVPTGMAAYADVLRDRDLTKRLLDDTYRMYRARLDFLVPKLKTIGLRPACETTSGFFTLWLTPDEAFGVDLVKESNARGIPKAELFNRLVIEKTGIVGVHFSGPKDESGFGESFIRYAVCTDVLADEFRKRFEPAIASIQPKYCD
ncbi:MAG: pyridoxal phosphate-dependent aminotransferase [Cryobacterium sp.]|nr:pyridoxal phosphate-dependent aminotransferase [Oligoflexia bacterium]